MSIDQQTNPYDETYYRVGCGVPYERNEHWLTFFGKIADAIVREINPGSVLDAGCAMGFLVEALRQRGVEAYGVDISDYAIAQVADEIKPYCWVGSVTERLPRRYDLVVCIETLEHLHAADVPAAIQQLCAAADDILFSSTPDDRTEPTHFSVQQPEAWVSLFAAQGFWHDVEFDASFVTPWAMRFRKTGDPAHRALIPLERALWSLRRENTALRDLANSLRATPAEPSHDDLQQRIAQLEDALRAQQTQPVQAGDYWRLLTQAFNAVNSTSHADELRKEVITLSIENQRLHTELKATSLQLSQLLFQQTTLQSRAAYKVFTRTVRSIDTLLPEGSVRSRAFRKVSRTLKRQRVTVKQVKRVKGAETDASETSVTPGPVLAAQAVTSMPYAQWTRETTPARVEMALSKQQMAQWTYQPVISLMTPVFDPPLNALRDTIESVLGQIYERWELCLVDGGSKNPAIRDLLKLYAERDPRIKLKLLDQNLGISGNTNEAARLATGEFVQIFDHDDLLEPHALFEVVKALQTDPTFDVIYFDEDKVSADGMLREEPFFKPDWSPEMLLCANYLTHCIIRRSLYEEVGGFDSAMDGAQDWDLLLRLAERTSNIHHIPHVLYHWRKVYGSAAGSLAAKPYAYERQLRSIAGHLQRRGIAQAQANRGHKGFVHVTWPIVEEPVSIIIPTKDKVGLLKRCIETLFSMTTYHDFEVILVDTGSVEKRTLEYYKTLKANPQLQGRLKFVEYSGEFNYSRANNVGAQHASGSLLLFLNNDTEIIEPDWLEEMVRWAQRPEIGVVGAKLLFPSGHIQHAGVVVGLTGHAGHIFAGLDEHAITMFGSTDWYRDYMAVTGACMMTRRAVFDEIGGFDEEYLIAFSDIEYCLRARDHGYKSVYTPYACLKHHESASRGSGIPLRDVQRGYEHMYPIVDRGDPYFNANLATAVSVPTLAVNDAPERAERLRRVVREWEFYFKE